MIKFLNSIKNHNIVIIFTYNLNYSIKYTLIDH